MAMITGAAVVDEDRISNLSDDLLHHILSFLPSTQPRAQTSLLSRRFRHLWAYHPDLHLSFLSPPHNPSAVQSYVLSVDRCLRSFASPYIRSFSIALFLPSPTVFEANSEVAADRWLRFAALRSVRYLYVRNFYIRARSQACIPSSLFCCHRSVEDLKTTFCQFPTVPRNNFEGFSNLKKLSIVYCTVHDETLLDLLDCCPVLEILELVGCISLSFAVVSSQSLKKLDLSLNLVEMGTRVDAPNLRCIQYIGDLVKLDWEGSSDLLDATLFDSGIGDRIMNLNEWKSIVSAVSSVRFLKVNCWFFQFEVPKDYVNGFMFKNLKELCCDIKWLTRNVFRTLTYNLGECPVLEKLCIELGGEIGPIIMDEVLDIITANYLKGGIGNYEDAILKCVGKYDEAEWDPSQHFSELDYSLSHLKIITLKEFLGSKNEMRLVEFLLEKAVVLEKFIIFDLFKREEPKLRDLFVDVPRASSHVQMELH